MAAHRAGTHIELGDVCMHNIIIIVPTHASPFPPYQANREAPTLRFDDGRADLPQMSTTAALAAAFVPSTPLEEQVAALLAKAKANDAKAVAEAEEQLAVRTMTPQELAARQEQLARMRSVLFHHERRLKRLAKIKSKDYRRRLKKAAQKQVCVSVPTVWILWRLYTPVVCTSLGCQI